MTLQFDPDPLRSLPPETVRRLSAGQCVVDIPSIVKELIENALDAQATLVTIRLVNYGLTAITVTDNGHGIPRTSHSVLGACHATSKLQGFNELAHVATLGFRGEALNAICSSGYQVQITTRTSSDPVATVLKLDRQGRITQTAHAPQEVGTTVFIEKPLYTVPIRRQMAERRVAQVLVRIHELIEAYVLVFPLVRFACHAQQTGRPFSRGKQPLVTPLANKPWIRLPAPTPWVAVARKVGKQYAHQLQHVRMTRYYSPTSTDRGSTSPSHSAHSDWSVRPLSTLDTTPEERLWPVTVGEGMVLDVILPKPDADVFALIQESFIPLVYANRRPMDVSGDPFKPMLSTFRTTLRERYASGWGAIMAQGSKLQQKFSDSFRPFFWLHIQLPPTWLDVNVEPSKRYVLLHYPELLTDLFNELLGRVYPCTDEENPEMHYSKDHVVSPTQRTLSSFATPSLSSPRPTAPPEKRAKTQTGGDEKIDRSPQLLTTLRGPTSTKSDSLVACPNPPQTCLPRPVNSPLLAGGQNRLRPTDFTQQRLTISNQALGVDYQLRHDRTVLSLDVSLLLQRSDGWEKLKRANRGIYNSRLPRLVGSTNDESSWVIMVPGRGICVLDSHRARYDVALSHLLRTFSFTPVSLRYPLVLHHSATDSIAEIIPNLAHRTVTVHGQVHHYIIEPELRALGYEAKWYDNNGRPCVEIMATPAVLPAFVDQEQEFVVIIKALDRCRIQSNAFTTRGIQSQGSMVDLTPLRTSPMRDFLAKEARRLLGTPSALGDLAHPPAVLTKWLVLYRLK
ncbi:hypothetical protein IWQ62_004249 [Dispira parvispora]|uniref:DNA mismatch repair protein S5 domain-containing protein n=1 Tax=Dispira parvispora TaxID=1520584 RepID=A0A9W8AQ74_9FUNG|nr:hypothetical protein IWQ62_004249 [Dispira parvispora]